MNVRPHCTVVEESGVAESATVYFETDYSPDTHAFFSSAPVMMTPIRKWLAAFPFDENTSVLRLLLAAPFVTILLVLVDVSYVRHGAV